MKVLLLLLLLPVIIVAEEYMWLGREQPAITKRRMGFMNDPVVSTTRGRFVVIISQGENPNTFLTVPLAGRSDTEIHQDHELDADVKSKFGGTFVEALARVASNGMGTPVGNINHIEQLSLVPHNRAQEMINRLDGLRQQNGWIDYMKRHDTQTRLEYIIEYNTDRIKHLQ